jgi:uncharacterized protein DUF1236
MNRLALLTSVAVAVAMSAASAVAQMQQKGPDDKGGAPQMQNAPDGQPQGERKKQDGSEPRAQKAEPKKDTKGTAQSKDQPGKGTAQTEPKDKATKGTAQKSVEPKDKAAKGTAEKGAEPKDKTTKGTAEKGAEPKDKATKGTAEKGAEPKDKATAEKGGTTGRVQLSEQQRTNVHQTILKTRNLNRVTNLNISINVGTRVPRSVRLVALPAEVIAIVPAFRAYRYFVIDDRVCIVDPATFEVVEIITISGQTAGRGGPATLVLTEEEKAIILREVDMSGGSTLALGALTEGAEVPRGVELRVFSAAIVEKVPKVRGYKFFTAENRVAIVDQRGARVLLVIEERR